MSEIIKTERGWAGHYIMSDRCLFRRNTLIEYGETTVVISTVGNLIDIYADGYPNIIKIIPCGNDNNYFETLAGMAKANDPYKDMDVCRLIEVDMYASIMEPYKEQEANNMHENIVNEICKKLLA